MTDEQIQKNGVADKRTGECVRRIAISSAGGYFDRYFTAGALKYAKEHGVSDLWLTEEVAVARVVREAPDELPRLAVLGNVWDADTIRKLARRKVPCVLTNVSNPTLREPGVRERICVCSTDNLAIGAMAADYFRSSGRFESYAYVGITNSADDRWWVSARHEGFRDSLSDYGIHTEAFHIDRLDKHPSSAPKRMRHWLAGLPKPAAVFACNDHAAHDIIASAVAEGVKVPGELSVLGVDNNLQVCENSPVAISSIVRSTEWLGYRAMELLVRMMRGEESGGRTLLCPPVRIEERESTKRTSHEDVFVRRVREYVEANVSKNISTADIVKMCGASRRFVEQRFRTLTGRTLHEMVQGIRIDRVKIMLRDTDAPMGLIASECGFRSVSGLCTVFKRIEGIGMREYRRQSRFGGIVSSASSGTNGSGSVSRA